jgi:acetoacetyl-CoA reductase
MSVAVVTGGTRGIGASISKALKADGHAVAAIYQSNDKAAHAFRDETGVETFRANVADMASCASAVARIEEKLGPITILVNNAGITRDGFMHKMEEDAWREVISTNLDSCFNMSRAVITGMRDRNYGRVVNISSINGQKGQIGQTNYSAAKAGMIGFTKALAFESARKGITVNAICPGYINTEMTAAMPPEALQAIVSQIPVGRMGKPEEIADLVAFLSSDKAGFITGAVMTINGGQYMANG